jgi:hypothetical protein
MWMDVALRLEILRLVCFMMETPDFTASFGFGMIWSPCIAIEPETLCSGRVLTDLREEKGLNAKEEEKKGDGEGTPSASLDS